MLSQRSSAAICAVLFLIAHCATAQSPGEFNFYFSHNSAAQESHTIFKEFSNKRGSFKSGEDISLSFMFNRRYDSLYQLNPDDFQWTVELLPEGSYFDKSARMFFWKPTTEQTSDYLVKVRVSHQGISDSAFIAMRVEESWKSSLIPGLSYSLYAPAAGSSYGMFHGVSIEYLLIAWVARNNNRGPSHGRIFIKFDLLHSTDPDVSESFFYTTGLNLSLERNPRRSWMIPYFGVEFGGMYNQQWENIAQFTPLIGTWIYADRMNSINATVGYLYPSDHFGDLRGWRGSLGATFSLW